MRRLTPTQIGLIIAAVLILAFAIWTASSTRRTNPDRLPDGDSTAASTTSPQQRCAAQSTYDLIKRELFRRAAAVRGSDQAAFDKLAAYAVVRVDRPLLASEDEGTGAVGCTGALTLDLPPGVAVVGGRRTLSGDIGYALQDSADGNGQVLTLNNADSIVTPLATLARVGGRTLDPLAPSAGMPSLTPGVEVPPAVEGPPLGSPPPILPPPPQAPRPQAIPSPTASASPSFNCANARTRGEIAVCRNDRLAALDRQMAAQYRSAFASSDRRTRAELERSRGRFLGYRDQCPSDDCIADTYRGRMREIRDIADGRLR
jgi:uncharacterized protein YecT (DUF1311 family)